MLENRKIFCKHHLLSIFTFIIVSIVSVLSLAFLFFPFATSISDTAIRSSHNIAFASVPPPPNDKRLDIPNPLQVEGVGELLAMIMFAIFTLLIIVLPLILIYGAIVLMISGGSPEKVLKAKKIILYAGIGLIVVLFSRALVPLIRFVLGQ